MIITQDEPEVEKSFMLVGLKIIKICIVIGDLDILVHFTHLAEMYGTNVSEAAISIITDKLIPILEEWRNRSLESVYPIIFLDAMFFKMRENGRVVNKPLYNILGVNQSGNKEILGFYLAESEGANFWLGILNDLKARGIKDILIACIDGLTGFPEAIAAAFPKTEIQLCVIHQIRNSIKYISTKYQKSFMVDLKTVYQAETRDLAKLNLSKLDEKWGKKYPMVLKSWRNKWDMLATYFNILTKFAGLFIRLTQ